MPLTTTSSTSRCLYPSFSANPSLLSGLQRKAPSTPNLGGFQPGAVVTAAAARDSFIFIFYVFFPPFRPQARSRSPRSPRRRPGQAAPSAPLPPPRARLGSARPGPARPPEPCPAPAARTEPPLPRLPSAAAPSAFLRRAGRRSGPA